MSDRLDSYKHLMPEEQLFRINLVRWFFRHTYLFDIWWRNTQDRLKILCSIFPSAADTTIQKVMVRTYEKKQPRNKDQSADELALYDMIVKAYPQAVKLYIEDTQEIDWIQMTQDRVKDLVAGLLLRLVGFVEGERIPSIHPELAYVLRFFWENPQMIAGCIDTILEKWQKGNSVIEAVSSWVSDLIAQMGEFSRQVRSPIIQKPTQEFLAVHPRPHIPVLRKMSSLTTIEQKIYKVNFVRWFVRYLVIFLPEKAGTNNVRDRIPYLSKHYEWFPLEVLNSIRQVYHTYETGGWSDEAREFPLFEFICRQFPTAMDNYNAALMSIWRNGVILD